jgi:hypothetical protein
MTTPLEEAVERVRHDWERRDELLKLAARAAMQAMAR